MKKQGKSCKKNKNLLYLLSQSYNSDLEIILNS